MSLPIEHVMPDPHTFTVVINERQRKLIRRALRLLLQESVPNQYTTARTSIKTVGGRTGDSTYGARINITRECVDTLFRPCYDLSCETYGELSP